MKTFGWGRYRTGVYPSGNAGAGAATAALRNRNVAGAVALTDPYSPSSSNLIAGIVFTPRVSGVLQVGASFLLTNGADADIYNLAVVGFAGTGFDITGGEFTLDGWVVGTNPLPVLAGTPSGTILNLGDYVSLLANGIGTLEAFGITTPPQPLGVPVVIAIGMAAATNKALDGIAVTNLSVMELP